MPVKAQDGQLVLSKGAVALFTVAYMLLATIGAFGWNELRAFRESTELKFDTLQSEVSTIANTQAVLSERLDNTSQLESEVHELRKALHDLELEIARNPQ